MAVVKLLLELLAGVFYEFCAISNRVEQPSMQRMLAERLHCTSLLIGVIPQWPVFYLNEVCSFSCSWSHIPRKEQTSMLSLESGTLLCTLRQRKVVLMCVLSPRRLVPCLTTW